MLIRKVVRGATDYSSSPSVEAADKADYISSMADYFEPLPPWMMPKFRRPVNLRGIEDEIARLQALSLPSSDIDFDDVPFGGRIGGLI